jgi:glutathione synthase
VGEALIRLKKEGGDALSAYILMQRIFPKASLANLVRGGVCHEALTVSELGIYGAYLRYNQCLTHKVQAFVLLVIWCFFG